MVAVPGESGLEQEFPVSLQENKPAHPLAQPTDLCSAPLKLHLYFSPANPQLVLLCNEDLIVTGIQKQQLTELI